MTARHQSVFRQSDGEFTGKRLSTWGHGARLELQSGEGIVDGKYHPAVHRVRQDLRYDLVDGFVYDTKVVVHAEAKQNGAERFMEQARRLLSERPPLKPSE